MFGYLAWLLKDTAKYNEVPDECTGRKLGRLASEVDRENVKQLIGRLALRKGEQNDKEINRQMWEDGRDKEDMVKRADQAESRGHSL